MGRAEWLPRNQVVKLGHLCDIWVFVSSKVELVGHMECSEVNKDRIIVLVYRKTRPREFSIWNLSWRHVHHNRVGGRLTRYASWVGLGDNFSQPLMEDILRCGLNRTVN